MDIVQSSLLKSHRCLVFIASVQSELSKGWLGLMGETMNQVSGCLGIQLLIQSTNVKNNHFFDTRLFCQKRPEEGWRSNQKKLITIRVAGTHWTLAGINGWDNELSV